MIGRMFVSSTCSSVLVTQPRLVAQYGVYLTLIQLPWCAELANCVNYAKINNSMLCMRGHVSAGFIHCDILFLQGKRNGFRHDIVQVRKVNFLNTWRILIIQVKASKFATYSKSSLYVLATI